MKVRHRKRKIYARTICFKWPDGAGYTFIYGDNVCKLSTYEKGLLGYVIRHYREKK